MKITRVSILILLCFFVVGNTCGSDKRWPDCPVIGIDLGATYSSVAVSKDGKVEIIPNGLGNSLTPSVVAFTDEGILIGEAAKNQTLINPTRTIYDTKRLIGRRFSDREVQHDKKFLPYEIIDKGGKPYIKTVVNGKTKTFTPEEISAMLLGKMKEIAENYLGQKVKSAVIAVPAYFNDAQRIAIKDAGTISGLNVLRTINEPTAAAIAYGLDKKEELNIIVFDLGGSTFDVSVLSIEQGVFEILAISGDTHLGGEDFDQRVWDYFIKLIQEKYNKDISSDKRAIQNLKREIEKGKRALSNVNEVHIKVEDLLEGQEFSEVLTRAKFEDLNDDLFKKMFGPVQTALTDAGLEKTQINEIILVGGSTRIPRIQKLIKDYFNGKELNREINPDGAVVHGAAVQGDILCNKKYDDGWFRISYALVDYGIETDDGVMMKIIPRGTMTPTKKSQVINIDQQTSIVIKIFAGDNSMVKENRLLGKLYLGEIPRDPKGIRQIEVTFVIDADDILTVRAQDQESGKSESLVIGDPERLSQEEIERMIAEAEKLPETDPVAKKRIDARNALDNYIYAMKTVIEDPEMLANKISEGDRVKLKEAITKAQEWLDGNSSGEKDEFEEYHQKLGNVCEPIVGRWKRSKARVWEDL